MPVPYSVRWISRNVTAIDCSLKKCSDEFWFLITSDAHWDSADCDREMMKRHLDEAKQKQAGIIDNGDWYDLMQGKYDPRKDQRDLRPEHRGEDYLDRVTDTATEFLAPYAENLISFGHGNHETSVLKHNGVDMTERLCSMLYAKHGSKARCNGFSSWFQFYMRRDKQRKRITMYRHHGSGGASPITKGVISASRTSTGWPDAAILVSGHTHTEYILPIPRVRLSQRGMIYEDEQLHCRIPGYKNEMGDGYSGWSVEKGHGPKTKGALWIRLFWRDSVFRYECTRAQ